MSHALTLAEIDEQRAELLPARTVLSMFSLGGDGDGGAVVPICSQVGGTAGILGLLGTQQPSLVCSGGAVAG